MQMTRDELVARKDKPVYIPRFDCILILRAAKAIPDGKGGTRIVCKLQDRRVKSSYVIARAEELKQI